MAKLYAGFWTFPKFRIKIKWDDIDITIPFEEVSGLDLENEMIEYRNGSEDTYFKSKQPGISKYSNITIKRGTFKNKEFYKKWVDLVFKQPNNLTVLLEDEKKEISIKWKLKNTYPKTIKGIDVNSKENKVTIKSLKLKHEGMTLKKEK